MAETHSIFSRTLFWGAPYEHYTQMELPEVQQSLGKPLGENEKTDIQGFFRSRTRANTWKLQGDKFLINRQIRYLLIRLVQ